MIDALLERGLLPDRVLRLGIRRLLRQRLRDALAPGWQADQEALIRQLRDSPIALHTDTANEQHYELPSAFFERVLGRHLKYSAGYWPDGCHELDESEAAMLELTVERADLADGQRILELGCGWGSLSLFMAQRFPQASILAVSNSASQRRFILERAAQRGLANLEVRTADVNDLTLDRRFDRVVSVEMFEHVRNYPRLMGRIAYWLEPAGTLFVHIFCHRSVAYPFEDRGPSDWMARHFFTGGLMPSADLLIQLQEPFELEHRWLVDGRHYQRTCEAWLARMDAGREAIEPILAGVYGDDASRRWWSYWRVFFMACAELFGYRGGKEWMVAHYRFRS
ncbi:MAG: cyclopropane-fatty-acyl-phospholipid synthase family protein [Acidobacteriota bacterium]